MEDQSDDKEQVLRGGDWGPGRALCGVNGWRTFCREKPQIGDTDAGRMASVALKDVYLLCLSTLVRLDTAERSFLKRNVTSWLE